MIMRWMSHVILRPLSVTVNCSPRIIYVRLLHDVLIANASGQIHILLY